MTTHTQPKLTGTEVLSVEAAESDCLASFEVDVRILQARGHELAQRLQRRYGNTQSQMGTEQNEREAKLKRLESLCVSLAEYI